MLPPKRFMTYFVNIRIPCKDNIRKPPSSFCYSYRNKLEADDDDMRRLSRRKEGRSTMQKSSWLAGWWPPNGIKDEEQELGRRSRLKLPSPNHRASTKVTDRQTDRHRAWHREREAIHRQVEAELNWRITFNFICGNFGAE